MTYQEFTRQFKRQTECLCFEKQIELAISICKKLFFDYQKFSEVNNWGNSDLILDTIKFIEESKHLEKDGILLKEKIKQIEAVTPDTEDFDDASYALNACVAVCEALDFLLDLRAEHIYAVGTCLTDSVNFKIQEDTHLKESEIDNNSEMIGARNFLLEMSQ
jgi:uncharacterized protein YjaG (DUF416 family)